MGRIPKRTKPGATTEAATAYAAVVGIPMPNTIQMSMAKSSANSWFCWAVASSSAEKRPPTPVSEIIPTTIPAHAHTAVRPIALRMPTYIASAMRLSPMRLSLVNQLTTMLLKSASVPALVIELPRNIMAMSSTTGKNKYASFKTALMLGNSLRGSPCKFCLTASRSTIKNTAAKYSSAGMMAAKINSP